MYKNAIFKGEVIQRESKIKYDLNNNYKPILVPIEEYVVGYKVYHETFLDKHFLDVDDTFYIEALNISTTVEEVHRILEGGYLYITDHVVEVLPEDEESKAEMNRKYEEALKEYENDMDKSTKKSEENNKNKKGFWSFLNS